MMRCTRSLWELAPHDWGSAASAGASLVGGLISGNSASSAGSQAATTASNIATYQGDAAALGQKNLQPIWEAGRNASNTLSAQMADGSLTAGYSGDMTQPTLPTGPQTMTEAQLQQTPGYQFNLDQGLKSTQSSAAARGLGVSGAALKGAATYATGLADSTYQNQFNNAQTQYQDKFKSAQQTFANKQQGFDNYQTQQNNSYNKLFGIDQLGEQAAANAYGTGTTAVNNAANTATGGANAQAAGTVGYGNALQSGLNGISNQVTQNQYISAMRQNQGYNDNSNSGSGSGSLADYYTGATGGYDWVKGIS